MMAATFDIYLEIYRKVEEQVLAALGRDSSNWRVLNACPPCGYEVSDIAFCMIVPNILYSLKTNHISGIVGCLWSTPTAP
jgi:hypothetical protein